MPLVRVTIQVPLDGRILPAMKLWVSLGRTMASWPLGTDRVRLLVGEEQSRLLW